MCASELGHYGSGYGLWPFRWLAIACTSTDLISHPGLGWLNAFSSFPPQPLWLLITKPFILNLRYLEQRGCSSGYWVVGILDSPCLSVRLSVCPLTFRVRPVTSTVQDGFFPYLVQMITSMRMCVACDDLWPWPISSRSFDLAFENRVRGGGYPRRWHRLIYLVVSGIGTSLDTNHMNISNSTIVLDRAGVLVLGNCTRSTRVLNFWYSYFIASTLLVLVSSKVIVLILALLLVDKYSGTRMSTGTSTDILRYICDVKVKTITTVK